MAIPRPNQPVPLLNAGLPPLGRKVASDGGFGGGAMSPAPSGLPSSSQQANQVGGSSPGSGGMTVGTLGSPPAYNSIGGSGYTPTTSYPWAEPGPQQLNPNTGELASQAGWTLNAPIGETQPGVTMSPGVKPNPWDNYYGLSADHTRAIERLGSPAPLDQSAFQLPGYAGIEYQAQTIGQRAGDMYGNALAQGNQAAGNVNQSRALALGALTAPGPSAAELQLRAGQDANMQSALAMARSGRGFGSGGQLRNAAIAGQQGMQQTNTQAGILRAQEEAQRRQQLLALGAQDIGALGQAYGQQLGAGQLGLGAVGQQAGLSQAQQQALADRAKLDAGMALDISKTNANFANYEQPAAPDNTWSDIAQATGAAGGAAAGLAALGALAFSDERSKTQIQNLEEENAALRKNAEALGAVTAADRFATLPSYSYEYKQPAAPGAAPGTQVGPMAQDLEKVLPGAVQDTAQGKMVDTGRLSLANASATSELARRLAALEGKKPKREDLGTLPAMQVDIPRPQSRLAALGAR